MTWLVFVLLVLAVVRGTRLVTTDSIAIPLRRRLIDHHGGLELVGRSRWVAELALCDWCVSFWLAGLAVVLARWVGGMATGPIIVLVWWGVAGAAGLLLDWLSRAP